MHRLEDPRGHGRVVRLTAPALRPRRRVEDRLQGAPAPPRALTAEGDRALLHAARLGDERAWAHLVDAYAGPVWTWCREQAGDGRRAREVAELVWLRLAQVLPDDVPGRPLGPWLHAAVVEEAARARRSAPGG